VNCCPVQVVIEPVCDLSLGREVDVLEEVSSRECPAPASGSETS
jgi:hypothetical protein